MADNEITQVDTFVDQLAKGNNAEAGDAFKGALRDKVGDALDTSRKEYASSLFQSAANVMTGEVNAEDHSDPKPEIASPIGQDATEDEVKQAFNQATPGNTGE